jgi:hypothetical protein
VILLRKTIIVLVGVILTVVIAIFLLDPPLFAGLANTLAAVSPILRGALALLVVVLALFLLIALVRDPRPRATDDGGLLVKAQGALTDVSVSSVRERVLKAIRDVPSVKSAEAQVKSLRGRADVELQVVVTGEGVNLPNKQREIDRALRQVVNKQLGLRLAGKPRVHIHLDDDLPVAVGAIGAPTGAPSAPSVIVPPSAPMAPASERPGLFGWAASESASETTSTPVVHAPAPEPEEDESVPLATLVRDTPAPVESPPIEPSSLDVSPDDERKTP